MFTSEPSRPRVDVRLLGPVRVDVGGRPLAVDTRKALALLAYVVTTGRPVSRDGLAALLWPESGEADARGALRRTLSVLNAGLAGVGLTIDRATVGLRLEELDVDLWRFRAALEEVRRHGHGPDVACPACLTRLDEAVAASAGEFLEGFSLRDSEPFDEWQRAEAASHRRDLASTLERLARGRASGGAWPAAIVAGRRWLDLDSLHEPAHRLLMTVLARAGEPAAAIAQYRDCLRTLDAELGVSPLPETTDLYEAIRAGEVDAASPAPSTARSLVPEQVVPSIAPALAGRDEELAAVLAAVRSIGPHGRGVIVAGEPGIGKTRLVGEAVREIRRGGGRVLEARAHAGEASIAFGPIADLLRVGLGAPDVESRLATVRPDLLREVARLVPLPAVPAAEAVDDPLSRSRLVEGLADTLTALVRGERPGAIWVDDLHHADASTIDVVAFLANRLSGRPLAVLVAWRSAEVSERLAGRLLDAGRDGLVTRLELGRLGRTAVAELASEALGAEATPDRVDRLVAESEGLPLYVVEILAEAARGRAVERTTPGMPGGVQRLLRSRIAAAEGIAAQLLAAAAVIGRTFDLDVVRAASGRSEDEAIDGLEELIRRGLVREVDGPTDGVLRYDFTHGGLRDVAYESLGLARRRLIHRRAAAGFAASPAMIGQDRVRWSLVAHHETLAGRTAEAAEAHRRAGDHARLVFANEEARIHLETALALGHPAVAALDEALGEILILLGDYAAAIVHLEAAAARAGPSRQPRIERQLGMVHARRGAWAQADNHLVAALALLDEDDGSGELRSRMIAERSAIALRRGDDAEAARLATSALAVAEATTDPGGVARARDLLGILARRRGDLAEAASQLEQALAATDAADAARKDTAARKGAAREGPAREGPAREGPARQGAARQGEPSGGERAEDPGLRVAVLNTLGLVRADAGDPEGAIEAAVEALALCERQGDRHRQAALENNLADFLHAASRPTEAMDHLKRAVSLFAEIGGEPGALEPEIWKLVEW